MTMTDMLLSTLSKLPAYFCFRSNQDGSYSLACAVMTVHRAAIVPKLNRRPLLHLYHPPSFVSQAFYGEAGLSCFQENLSGITLTNIFNSNVLAADWSAEARDVHPCGLYYDVSVH